MQNAAIAAAGLDWRYLAFEVAPSQLREAIEGCRAMKFIGLNLTVPHKLLAVPMVDVLDASAEEWGAVNTIRFEAQDPTGTWKPLGQWTQSTPDRIRTVGFNTDADGLLRALEEDLNFRPAAKSVLVLGAGGAGRVAALRLAASGCRELFLVNRTESKVHELASEMQRRYPGTQARIGYPTQTVDLVLNATSLGLKATDDLPFDPQRFELRNATAAYDMIYRPAETPFLSRARSAGCKTANGLGMLLHQGARAFEIWSDQKAPTAVMREALQKAIYG